MEGLRQFLYTTYATRLQMLTEGPTAAEQATVGRHVDYLSRLAERGVVLLAGRTQTRDEHTFGIVILQAESEEAAMAVMREDPAIAGGVMRGTLYPYRIAVIGAPRVGPR
jgi:uncharacterized protein YciI